jgi:hypothetical protein
MHGTGDYTITDLARRYRTPLRQWLLGSSTHTLIRSSNAMLTSMPELPQARYANSGPIDPVFTILGIGPAPVTFGHDSDSSSEILTPADS